MLRHHRLGLHVFIGNRLRDGGGRARHDMRGDPMTEHERRMVTALCARISEEKDPVLFTQLVIELDALLEKLNNHQPRRTGFEAEKMTT